MSNNRLLIIGLFPSYFLVCRLRLFSSEADFSVHVLLLLLRRFLYYLVTTYIKVERNLLLRNSVRTHSHIQSALSGCCGCSILETIKAKFNTVRYHWSTEQISRIELHCAICCSLTVYRSHRWLCLTNTSSHICTEVHNSSQSI